MHKGAYRGAFFAPPLWANDVFMLTHGKEVRRVSFLLAALKALPDSGLRDSGEVSSMVMFG